MSLCSAHVVLIPQEFFQIFFENICHISISFLNHKNISFKIYKQPPNTNKYVTGPNQNCY